MSITLAQQKIAERKALSEKAADILKRASRRHDETPEEQRTGTPKLTAEERTEHDNIHNDIERLNGEIDVLLRGVEQEQKAAEQEARLAGFAGSVAGTQNAADPPTGDDTPEERAKAQKASEERHKQTFSRYLRHGMAGLEPEERQIMAGTFQKDDAIAQAAAGAVQRAQSVGTVAAGGYLAPESFSNQLEQSMLAWGGMFEAARRFPTADGRVLPWPTVDDTSNKGAILAENTEVDEQDFTFSEVQFDAYMYTSKLVRVSIQLLDDSFFDLDAFLADALGVRLGRIINEHATDADGSSKPNGFITAASSGLTAGSATDLVYTDYINLKHSVDPAYRQGPSVRYMLNDTTLKEAKLFLDGNSRPMWQSGMSASEPNTIDGDPYTINQDMDSTTTGAFPLAYGDFSKYIMREVRGTRVLRLQERFAEFLQVGFLAFRRFDSDLLDAGTDPIKYVTMA